jgi:4,5-dihydroxyphthalate decarboxylase
MGVALKLTMTCGPYDRARALIEGTVKPEGIDLEVTANGDDQVRQKQAREGRFDVCEFYTGTYITDVPFKTLGFTAIPIFVKRMFRHSYIYVNKRAGIRSPADLNGRRIGIQAWFTTAALWGRGLLIDDYGLDFKSVTWVAHRPDTIGGWKKPDWLKLEHVPEGGALFDLLVAGELDAAITTETMAPGRHPDVDFLFPNYAEVERDYYRRTGFFPIHHTLLIRTSVLEEHPWVAMSMFNAWQESKQRCYEWLRWQRVHQTSLWYRSLWEEEQAAGGEDFYVWGFRKSRPELEKMLEYVHLLELTERRLQPEELFHPSTLET